MAAMLAEKEAKEAALLKPHLTRLMANTALNGFDFIYLFVVFICLVSYLFLIVLSFLFICLFIVIIIY
jgi:hypothetical protein